MVPDFFQHGCGLVIEGEPEGEVCPDCGEDFENVKPVVRGDEGWVPLVDGVPDFPEPSGEVPSPLPEGSDTPEAESTPKTRAKKRVEEDPVE